MNLKRFEYFSKDVPFLKRGLFFRFLFFVLFMAVITWQITSMIVIHSQKGLSIPEIISGVTVILLSLLLGLISIAYVFKNMKVIEAIKKHGRCICSVPMLINIKKNSFIRLYSAISFVLALLALVVLLSSLTYSLLQAAYYATVSFYLPLLVLISVAGFNSVFHLKNEIQVLTTVQEYHSPY